ncbi:hypothetical protein [Plantactinospora sp. KBS50]|uniref:hypothetical protein n=1 Tax=Plantactinospora sp. KBS50 TaxID=2024580 RepID=UPI0012FD6963|nr:hypothetical protein [Plantactinospora sp. KBS50]
MVAILGPGVLVAACRGPLRTDRRVPSCADLAEALPRAVAGSWTLDRAEPNRAVSKSVVGCEFDFRSADQEYQGTIVVDISADRDGAVLRKKATDGPCYGTAVTQSDGAHYDVARSCLQRLNGKAFVGMFVASDGRYAHTLTEIGSATMSQESVAAYATTSARSIIDRAMTLRASD